MTTDRLYRRNMLKYVTHENSEDGQKTVVIMEDEQGERHELLLDDIPTHEIESERSALAHLYHDIHHWGYKPPECCHCLSFHAFAPHFCGLNHPMDYFRVYCATCPDVNKKVQTVWNEPPKVSILTDEEMARMREAKPIEPQPPTKEEIEKKWRENHCHVCGKG